MVLVLVILCAPFDPLDDYLKLALQFSAVTMLFVVWPLIGIMAFATMLFVPFALAIVIYIGAFAVSDDVYAAKAAGLDDAVASWKHNLVGVCPLH